MYTMYFAMVVKIILVSRQTYYSQRRSVMERDFHCMVYTQVKLMWWNMFFIHNSQKIDL